MNHGRKRWLLLESLPKAYAEFMNDPRAAWSSQGTNGKAVLFVHGFTGSPASLTSWAQHFAAAGYSVEVPLLPGHGTSPAEMNKTRWQQWYLEAERAYESLAAKHEGVAVCALSMGGALALRLGALKKVKQPRSLVLVNPLIHIRGVNRFLIPVVSKVLATQPAVGGDIKKPGGNEYAYDKTPLKAANSLLHLLSDVQGRIATVKEPLMLIHSKEDHVVPSSNAEWILSNVGSSVKEEVLLFDSYHVATVDNDAPEVFEKSKIFIEQNW